MCESFQVAPTSLILKHIHHSKWRDLLPKLQPHKLSYPSSTNSISISKYFLFLSSWFYSVQILCLVILFGSIALFSDSIRFNTFDFCSHFRIFVLSFIITYNCVFPLVLWKWIFMYSPVPGRWPKSKVNVWWGPSRDPRKKVNELTAWGVAKMGRRQGKASPRWGIA